MDLDLGGKLALITGGSRGIGRAVGEALAAEGCRLVLVSRRAADLNVARTQIEGRYNVSVRTDAADLGDSTNVARLAQLFPDVDILVNNAGAIPGGTLFDVDEARWRTAWDLKVLGTINMTRAFYPLMKARGGGAIINVIGNAARTHDPDYICGVTGNAGLTAFTEAIGSGSMRDGIRVNGVSPGPTATDRLVNLAGRKAQERFGDPARWPDLYTSLPAGRVGQPAEVAAMVAFLASPKSSYTIGVVIPLDAGISSRSGAGEGARTQATSVVGLPLVWTTSRRSRRVRGGPLERFQVGGSTGVAGLLSCIPTPGAGLADPFQAQSTFPGARA